MEVKEPDQLGAEERRELVLAQRRRGRTFPEIARHLGVSDSRARLLHSEALAALPVAEADKLRMEQAEKLDYLIREAYRVLERVHVVVQSKEIIRDPETDQPMVDDKPTLAAITVIAKLEEQKARLLGLNAPVKVEASGEVRYTFGGVDLSQL